MSPTTAAVVPLATPAISSLTPSSGPTSGGNDVVIAGTGLSAVLSVHFGSSTATFAEVPSTRLNVIAPPGSGTVSVNVTTVSGTSNSLSYIYFPPPTLTSLSVTSGPSSGGNSVTLTGTNLSAATSVRFGPSSATFTVVSSTQIIATAPPGTGTTTPGGTSAGVGYTYVASPGS
ncbi:IPT/TIG domain-containing protein [Amycolatopsis pigmentata]|uniref:IPT/TIG domain-containing protein n=1 Tax=Amycolatopsis pigmentata TaxID=450801 RepID=A0ABW5G1R8_9PSEU